MRLIVAKEALADGGLTRRDLNRIPDDVPAEIAHARRPADPGSESPQESRLRLLIVREGIRRPVTQIQVSVRRIDMGWPEYKVGVEYDGMQHWTDPDIHDADIERLEFFDSQGWLIVRVSSKQLRYKRALVVQLVLAALAARGYPL